MARDIRIALADLPVGGKKQVGDGGANVLFVRDEAGVRAFQATCPHYGAPLEKGEICGSKLYCPWHKAVFDIGDGTLLEPPALKSLDRYPVRIEGDCAIAAFDPVPVSRRPPSRADATIVIVGTGAAGVAAATTLRREGFAGRIAMIGREDSGPYDRPKLSKNFLAKKTPADKMLLEPDFYAAHGVERIDGPAARIDPAARRVTLDNGDVVEGDALLIATGSRAVMPEIPGHDLSGVHTLRGLADAVSLSDAAETAKTVVVIGGGFIGLEAAAFLTKRGLVATVVSRESAPLAARFGEAIASGLKRYHEGNGVRFLKGEIERLEGSKGVESVRLDDGRTIAADMVLIGVGAAPETGAVDGIAKRDDGGIEVDETLAIATAVYVAGDIAAFPERTSGLTARIEHWRLAQQHGTHVALAMLGKREGFAGTPFFWSNQGDKRLDYAGYAKDWDRIVMHGDPEQLDFMAYYVKDRRVVAACSIGRNAEFIACLHRMGEGNGFSDSEIEF